MNNIFRSLIALSLLVFMGATGLKAGNKDRSGQAGAAELLINPWARSSGWGNAGMASIKGLEGTWSNVAGLAFSKKTDIHFSHTNWIKGADVNINAFGFSQRVGESGVLGLAIMSMNFGDIPITTTESPDGGLGTFSLT